MKWNKETRELILATTATLRREGMTHPTIRTTLYRLLKIPGWNKDLYNTMCRKLGEWRDAGLVPFGLFAEWGARERPYTASEIRSQIEAWERTMPYELPPDGAIRVLLVEHQNLIIQIEEWCENQAFVVSSAGQLRRENLWTAMKEWLRVKEELNAKEIVIYGLLDYDKGGTDIAGAHKRWFENVAGIHFEVWGLNRGQLAFLNLPTDEDHQIDGAFGINPSWWKMEIRRLLRIENRKRKT